MTTVEGRCSETIIEAVLRDLREGVPVVTDRSLRTALFVDNVDAVASAMATRNALRLSIETHVVHSAEVAELAHGGLRSSESTLIGHRHSTLNPSVRASVRGKAGSLIRQDLVRSQLLLIKSLLLLLKGFDLTLESDLSKDLSTILYATIVAYLFGHDTRYLATVSFTVLNVVLARRISRNALLLRELEAKVFLIDGWTHHASATLLRAKHEAGCKLRTASGTNSLLLLLSGKSSKARSGEAHTLRLGAVLGCLLLLLLGVVLLVNLAFLDRHAVGVDIFHHRTKVWREGVEIARKTRGAHGNSLAVFCIRGILDSGVSGCAWLEDRSIERERRSSRRLGSWEGCSGRLR